jgi:peptidoglycan/LPS O-acetylase OafA/YrhL
MFQTIQASRGIAALLVVLFHVGITLSKDKYFGEVAETIDRIFSFGGRAGVAFFFVLSGFIISHVHHADLGRPDRFMPYLRKRIKRIYPIYLFVFLAVFGSALAIPSLRDTVPHDPLVILKSILLLPQDKLVVGRTGAPVLDVAWTLQYEMVFYLAFGAAILYRRLFWLVAALFAANYFLQFFADPYEFPRRFFTHHLIFLFLFGVAAAALVRSKWVVPQPGAVVLAGTLAFCGVAAWAVVVVPGEGQPLFDIGYGAASFLLIVGLTAWERAHPRGLPQWRYGGLGDASYALYLIHFPLVSALCKIAVRLLPKTEASAWVAFVLIVEICVLAGLLLHRFVEKPLVQGVFARRPVLQKQAA